MKKNDLKKQYFVSFDYLRVFFALSIVAWHTKAFGPTNLTDSKLNLTLRDIIYSDILLVAVPIFAQVSMFLYFINREIKQNYFWKRIINLLILYFFWMILLIILFYRQNLVKLQTLEFWFSGGASPLYFLLVIIIMTIIAEIFIILKKIFRPLVFVYLSLFLLIVSIIVLQFRVNIANYLPLNFLPFLLSHWSPINFIPYVFSSAIFIYLYQQGFFKRKDLRIEALLILFLIVVISYFEYKLMSSQISLKYDGLIIPPYARLSIIFSTLLIFYIFLNKNFSVSLWIQKFSELTMGIYILHVFVMNLVAGFSGDYFQIIRNSVVYFELVLLISLVLTYLIKQKRII